MKINKPAFGKFIFIILPPLLFTLLLYPLDEKLIFNGKQYQNAEFVIDDIFKKEPTFKNFLADTFSVPLRLDWYKVIIANHSANENPFYFCLSGEKPSITSFYFNEGDPRKYGTNLIDGESVQNLESKYPWYNIESGQKKYFIAPSWEKLLINGGLVWPGDCKLEFPKGEDSKSNLAYDFDISIKPYLPSWLAKLTIIFLIWLALLSSVLSIKKWMLEK